MKYMGSKARIAQEILPIILMERSDWYVEPFAGGCNIIDKVEGNRIANDTNPYLISMWKAIIDGWEPYKVTREIYNQVRADKKRFPDYFVGWVGFNCSYSGKFFGGFAGETKTKIDTIRDYQQEAINNVLKQRDKLKGVIFTNKAYSELEIPQNSTIYCDPPYKNTTKYNSDFDHDKFWNWVRANSRNHRILVSEYSAPDDFECVWSKTVKSSLSANGRGGGNKDSVERLFIKKD